MGRMIFNILDFDGDRQQVSFETVDAALDGTDYGGWVTDVSDLQAALAAIILGNNGPLIWQSYESGSTPAAPSDPFAQTNIQWIFEFTDNVSGSKRTTRVGTADLDVADTLYNGAPAINLATGVGATLKTAFETLVRSDGNSVTLNAVYFRE
jgi:hypothetical protein